MQKRAKLAMVQVRRDFRPELSPRMSRTIPWGGLLRLFPEKLSRVGMILP